MHSGTGIGRLSMDLVEKRVKAFGDHVGVWVADLGGSIAGGALRCQILNEEQNKKQLLVTATHNKKS